METKEAIELLEKSWIAIGDKVTICISEERANNIISLLKQGENNRIELADENQMLKNHIEDLIKD